MTIVHEENNEGLKFMASTRPAFYRCLFPYNALIRGQFHASFGPTVDHRQ